MELCSASGEVWDSAGGDTEQGMGTRVGGLEGTFLCWSSVDDELSVFAIPVLGITTWRGITIKSVRKNHLSDILKNTLSTKL